MTKAPRCPVCGATLGADRTIAERFVARDDGPNVWEYRLACPSCLAVVRVDRLEGQEGRRAPPPSTHVDVAGAVVSRLLARIDAARDDERLGETVASIVRDEEERILLRIPEVFARARRAWGERVTLGRDLVCVSPLVSETGNDVPRLVGRVDLRQARARSPRVAFGSEPVLVSFMEGAAMFTLASGMKLTVSGTEGGTLLLAPPRTPDGWFDQVEALVAWPDLVEPA